MQDADKLLKKRLDVVTLFADVVASFVMCADRSGRRIERLAVALGRQNDKGSTDFLGF